MILNGKALVRAMKEAKKHGGYRVFVDGAYTVIYCWHWGVRCLTKQLPPNVFGKVAEDLMQWPESGECWFVTRKEVQKELSDTTEDILKRLAEAGGMPLRKTPLDLKGWELWQTIPGMKIVAFDPALTALCTEYKPEYITTTENENVARWLGCVSTVWAFPLSDGMISEQQLRHLEQLQWAEE